MLALFSQILNRSLSRAATRCLLCNTAAGETCGLCSPCVQDLPPLLHACRRCALPLSPDPLAAGQDCARCLQQPPAIARARACWHYAFPVGQLIQRFKYRGDLAAGHSLAQLAAIQLQPASAELPDVLIALPLHWRRHWSRGFNQAQLIAETFSSQWRTPLKSQWLRKTEATGTQQQLKRRQRLQNLRSSFVASSAVTGLHIGLIDDVITTGATLDAAALTLLEAGASRISAFALARTP